MHDARNCRCEVSHESAGEKKEGSGSFEFVQCIIRRQFRAEWINRGCSEQTITFGCARARFRLALFDNGIHYTRRRRFRRAPTPRRVHPMPSCHGTDFMVILLGWPLTFDLNFWYESSMILAVLMCALKLVHLNIGHAQIEVQINTKDEYGR
ncbi:hypothetical protein EVAR_49832_1 [Eumeta japonica]|uniref:Uncharacterized protein n=1 Tax=Eumeta variegata TaxID=151549 RepID=A0A4C1Z245_EUMVA|nr:hypothetical protein EVAR_49832_1 [Eumeta japonica]